MKRLSKAFIIMGMSAVFSINTFAFNFKDVPANHWAYESVNYMQQKGYMTATSSNEFFPNAKISYFEISEILAKITGYQDELVVKDMDPTFKKSIKDNYTHQLPYIKAYDDKYAKWLTRTNEEIAYLLGRGYLSYDDLNKFMVKTATGQEVVKTVNKEDLAVLLVRALAKEETAKKEYKSTGFKDEAKITAKNRPHVAYLAKLGLIAGDKDGNFGPTGEVTRGICAKMTSDVLKYKEKTEAATKPVAPAVNLSTKGTVKNIIEKPNTDKEYFLNITLENGGAKFATLTQQTVILGQNNAKMAIKDIVVGDKVTAFIEQKPTGEYITKIYLTKGNGVGTGNNTGNTSGTTGGNTGGNTTGTNTGGTTGDTQTTKPETSLQSTSVEGTIDRIGRDDDLSILSGNKVTTYAFSKYCTFIKDGKLVDKTYLSVDDTVKAYIEGGSIIRVEVLRAKEANTTEKAEFVSSLTKRDAHIFTIKQGSREKELTISKDAEIIKNGRSADIEDLKVGDALEFKLKNDEVIEVKATAEKESIKGRVESILLGKTPKVSIQTKEGTQQYAITPYTEIYDKDQRKSITLEKVPIGSLVEVDIESKEVVDLTIEKATGTFSYKGTIQEVGRGSEDITILVDYDVLTQEARVEKRIKVPVDVSIIIDRVESYKSKLKEGMEVIVIFNYSDPLVPKSIEVISE